MSDRLALMAYLFVAALISAVAIELLDRAEPPRKTVSRPRWWAEFSADVREHRWLYILGLVSAVVGLALVLKVGGDWGNVGGELFGIALTVIVIAFLVRRGEREAHKKQLIFEMGSTVNDVAIKAVEELRLLGHLEDGSLRGARLFRAHLEGAHLGQAHLEGALLGEANLRRAELMQAHLEGASLDDAHLEEAHLGGAHLEGASLVQADLQGAFLEGAHLERTDLRLVGLGRVWLVDAHLEGAHLGGTDLSEAIGLRQLQIDEANGDASTVLPQGLARPEHWEE